MIRSIPNPPMDKEDIARFRRNLEKHLNDEYSEEERLLLEAHQTRKESNAKRIIANGDGKNPILGY